MSKTNIGLVEYAQSKLNLPTIYMLSGFGRVLTNANVDNRIKNGCAHTRVNEKTIRAGVGKYVFDCVGLIKGYLWEQKPGTVYYNIPAGSDQNVGMMYRSARRTGNIGTMPDIPGMLVFTKDLGHVGIYTGKKNGVNQYIEATPAWGAWGVTTSADRNHPQGHNRTWAFWGEYHLVDYVNPQPCNEVKIVEVIKEVPVEVIKEVIKEVEVPTKEMIYTEDKGDVVITTIVRKK